MDQVIFVDVREPEELTSNMVDGAVNVPLSMLIQGPVDLSEILPNKKAKLVLYCNSGNRSGTAINFFKKAGYVDVVDGINSAEVQRMYKQI
jgi:phage shock protein E